MRERIEAYADGGFVEQVDNSADKLDMSRSEFVREACRRMMQDLQKGDSHE